MARPPIQYAKTEDGVSVAFWKVGSGEPLVWSSAPYGTNTGYEWGIPAAAAAYTRLGQTCQLIKLDLRNSGLSDRGVSPVSLDDFVLDVEAVVSRLGLSRIVVWGGTYPSKVMISFAARHPDLVSRLILFRPTVSYGESQGDLLGIRHLRPLIESNWELYTDLIAVSMVTGLERADEARMVSEFIRRSYSPSDLQSTIEAIEGVDVSDLLPTIDVPVLVLHRSSPAFDLSVSRSVASAFPQGRLVVTEGDPLWPWDEPMLSAIESFMRGSQGRIGEEDSDLVGRDLVADGALSQRETEVLRLIARGCTAAEVGAELGITEATVARHTQNIYGKLDVHRRGEAIAWAIRHGFG